MQDVVTIGEIYTAQLAMFVCAERVYGIAVQGRTQGGLGLKPPFEFAMLQKRHYLCNGVCVCFRTFFTCVMST